MVTGLAVAGFGAGAFFFAPLAKALIAGGAYELLGVKLFTLPEVGVFNTFLVLGVIFLVCVVAGAQLLRNPPAGYVPAGWTPPQAKAAGSAVKTDLAPSEMLRTPTFWLLWVTYFAACMGGLQIIMKASPIWQSFSLGTLTPPVSAVDFGLIATAAAMAVSIIAIFNSTGRILWGIISDFDRTQNHVDRNVRPYRNRAAGVGFPAPLSVVSDGRLAGGFVLRRISRALSRADGGLLRHQALSASITAGCSPPTGRGASSGRTWRRR